MSFLLGLTGSIGMGKSTTARIFVDRGCKAWDADSIVHRAYRKNGVAVAGIGKIAPSAVSNGAVDHAKLRQLISQDANLWIAGAGLESGEPGGGGLSSCTRHTT